MKKILFFIAIALFSTIGFTSCSEDDAVMEIPTPNPNPNVGQQLVVTSNATYIKDKNMYFSELSKPVKFTTTSGSNTIADVIYYVDGVKINGNTYTHTTIATLKVQARRAGFIDSEIITLQFAQKPY